MLRTVFIGLAVLLMFQSCKKLGLCKDGEFTFSREEDNSNALKLNGYYYSVSEEYTNSVKLILLYQNGVVINGWGTTLDEVLDSSINLTPHENFNNLKSGWGIYRIENGTIEIQSWRTIQSPCKPINIEKGEIRNDSTFIINTSENCKGKKVKELKELYIFKKYNPKPDSTNSNIE